VARITLEQISKEYVNPVRRRVQRTVQAIAQVSLDVADGEFLTVLGPSGCGKTTLLRLVAGLEVATSGTIALAGRDVTQLPAEDRNMAMVFQRDALLPHLTAADNIALGLRLRGVNRADVSARVREAAELFQLGDRLDRLPQALSGGERQRAALARAFVRRPQAFLLDEPFAALDAPLRTELRGHLVEIHQRLGPTILHVTHDQAEAMALGQRVAVLHQGRLQQVATPAVLWREPANAFVAGFIGSPPMNLWRGTLSHQGGGCWFRAEVGTDQPAVSGSGSAESFVLGLTEIQAEFLRKSGREKLILGLAADHIVTEATAGGRSFPYGTEIVGTAEAVECLGADALVRWSGGPGTRKFVTRESWQDAPPVGTTARLIFDMWQAHFFDATTGLRLDPPRREGTNPPAP
jgi:multiple sugar transport system ATP-binding protein